MNSHLIEKVIKSDSNVCPEFTYENALLDRNVAKALSKSFVKILRVSQQNSNINNNLRYSILTSIRKACRMQPEGHMDLGETTANLLAEVYIEEFSDPRKYPGTNPIQRELDDFVTHRLKELDINSNYLSPVNPEIAQSLINLNETNIGTITQNVLSIDTTKKKSLTLVKDLWTKPLCENNNNICNVSLCMKPEIEKTLLDLSYNLLTDQSVNIKQLLCLDYLEDLVYKCSMSPECFQICSGILNSLFITVNYNSNIQLFISEFIQKVKKMCPNTVSVLYPAHLCHIVVLLDIDVGAMPDEVRKSYTQNTFSYLSDLHKESMTDFVLLLSHYPEWFDIYFKE